MAGAPALVEKDVATLAPFLLRRASHSLVLFVHHAATVTRYLPETVGVNLSVERSKLLLVSNVSVLQVSNVTVLAVTV